MYRPFVTILLALILLFSFATPVRAEGECGLLCSIFGWDAKTVERTQIKEDAATDREREKTEQTRIEEAGETQRAADALRLQNEYNAKILEINRMADTQIAQAQANTAIAQARKDEYIAMVENWRQVQSDLVKADLDKSLEAIRGQTSIGLAAITEAGETKRWALTTDMIWSVVLIVGLVILGWYFLKKQGHSQTIYVLPGDQHAQLPPGYRGYLPQGERKNEITQYSDHQW